MAKEKEYKVKVIKVLLKNNKTAKAGDVVKESRLINPHDALKGGYVELIKSDKTEAKSDAKNDAKQDDSKQDDSKNILIKGAKK